MFLVLERIACRSSEQVEQKRSSKILPWLERGEWEGGIRGNTHGH
jgi:hypothetical protein